MGHGTSRQISGAQPVAPDHCLLDSMWGGSVEGGTSASSTPRVTQKPNAIDKQEANLHNQ